MADALSRIEAVTAALDYERLAQSRSSDDELKQLLTASGFVATKKDQAHRQRYRRVLRHINRCMQAVCNTCISQTGI